jgi:hypothetical protein
MNNIVAEITKAVAGIQTCRRASITYLTKSAGELSRYSVNLGISYHNAVERSVTELEIQSREHANDWTALQKLAAGEVMASLQKTLQAHARGEQNEDYTKRGQYIPIGGGINLNTKDNTIQLFGLVEHREVLVAGTHKKVNSSAMTLAKKAIHKTLPVGKFREFAIDLGQVAQLKVNGDVIEIPEMASVS